MSSAALVCVCDAGFSYIALYTGRTQSLRSVKKIYIRRCSRIALRQWDPDLQNQIAPICTNLSGQPEVVDVGRCEISIA